MKLVLLKDLHYNGTFYEKGQEVDVDEASYKYIMETYMIERAQQVQKEAEAKRVLDAIASVEENEKKGSKK